MSTALDKLKLHQLAFVIESEGIHKPLYCDLVMDFQDYVLMVKEEILALKVSVSQRVKLLETFQVWIVNHFGVVLDVFVNT